MISVIITKYFQSKFTNISQILFISYKKSEINIPITIRSGYVYIYSINFNLINRTPINPNIDKTPDRFTKIVNDKMFIPIKRKIKIEY